MLALEAEALRQSGLGDLELIRRWIGGREPVLELMPRLRKSFRNGMLRVPDHPRKNLRRRRKRAQRSRSASEAACLGRKSRREGVAEGESEDERPDEVRAAPLVLAGPPVAVL